MSETNEDDVFVNKRAGHRPNSRATAQRIRKGIKNEVKAIEKIELAVVHSYNFSRQEVDVRLKNRPEVPVIEDVHIAKPSNVVVPLSSGDVGYMIWTDNDSRESFRDTSVGDETGRDQPASRLRHTAQGGFFVPASFLLDTETLDSTLFDETADDADTRKCGPSDWCVHLGGGAVILKSDGDVNIEAGLLTWNGTEISTEPDETT